MSGYIVKRASKIACMFIGSGLILLQTAKHYGYIEINWKKFHNDLEIQKDQTIKAIKQQSDVIVNEQTVDNTKKILIENATVALSFIGGFFIGFVF